MLTDEELDRMERQYSTVSEDVIAYLQCYAQDIPRLIAALRAEREANRRKSRSARKPQRLKQHA